MQLAAPSPARAVREVELPDGGPLVEAYEFDIELRAVALRGAVASDAKLDFQRALRRHARFKLEQRAQLADIYAELGNPRCASPTIAWHKLLSIRTCGLCSCCVAPYSQCNLSAGDHSQEDRLLITSVSSQLVALSRSAAT